MRPYKRAYMEKVEVILDFERWDLRRVTEWGNRVESWKCR